MKVNLRDDNGAKPFYVSRPKKDTACIYPERLCNSDILNLWTGASEVIIASAGDREHSRGYDPGNASWVSG